jgi:uncharacterized Rossmann fold enzyme
MRYRDWEPIYKEILEDFGFDREKDEEAAILASELIARKRMNTEEVKQELEGRINGKRALICGDAPCLDRDIKKKLRELDDLLVYQNFVVIAANGATSVLIHYALIPDIVVSDLDGTIADILYANRLGSIVVVHAHGDNIEMLKKVIPGLQGTMLCTTQSKPLRNVFNFGGFTDGDRCVFLAKEFGAKSIELLGFDFEDKDVSTTKKKKLKWAKRLIESIGNSIAVE